MKRHLFILVAFLPLFSFAQEQALFETLYLTPLPGHADELSTALKEHNERFHAEDPFTGSVRSVINGPRSGDFVWIMGPSKFSDYDNRPSGNPHDSDWANGVLSHASLGPTEYWVQNQELSYSPDGSDDEDRTLLQVRFFEVSNDTAFQELQRQIIKVNQAMGNPQPRAMYQKQFESRDGRDWGAVSSFANWSEVGDADNDFRAKFVEMHGESAWTAFSRKFAETVLSREDEWQQ